MTQWGLDAVFNPAKRHMDEEKRRLQSTRSETGDSSGGRRIDLESGKVTIRRPGADTEAVTDVDAGADALTDVDAGAPEPEPGAAADADRDAPADRSPGSDRP